MTLSNLKKTNKSRTTIFLFIILLLVLSRCGSDKNEDTIAEKTKQAKYNIILIAIDTLRADSIGCYGNSKSYTPNIDYFAKQSLFYELCIAPSSWTLPSFMSLMTSLYVPQHGITGKGFLLKSPNAPPEKTESLSKNIPTLAEILTNNGYHCEAVVANMLLNPIWGFNRGFKNYKQNYQHQIASKQTDEVCETLGKLLKNDKTPFFLFVHYMDPHAPYSPPYPFNKMYDPDYKGSRDGNLSIQDTNLFANIPKSDLLHLKALYDGEVTYVDYEIKRIMKLLEQTGLVDNTITIITSDHGEEFCEHNSLGHGNDLFQELIHVPLLVKIPNSLKTGIIHQAVSFIDIAPSLLSLIHVPIPKIWNGELLPGVLNKANGSESKRVIFSDLGHVYALHSNPYKLFHYLPREQSSNPNIILTPSQTPDENTNQAQSTKMNDLKTMPLIQKFNENEDKKMPDLNFIKNEYSIAYDIEKDPKETRDIFKDPQLHSVMKNLEDMLIRHHKSELLHPPVLVEPLDGDTVEQLKALGYLQ